MSSPMEFKSESQHQVVYDNGDGLVIRGSDRYVTVILKGMTIFRAQEDLDTFIDALGAAWDDRARLKAGA